MKLEIKNVQRGGGHVPNQLSHAQQQDSLSGTCQARHVGLLQMPVDKLHQIDDFPDNNMSKNYFHPFQGSWEVYAEPFDSYRRISAQPSLCKQSIRVMYWKT
jgi:hypothetical protein